MKKSKLIALSLSIVAIAVVVVALATNNTKSNNVVREETTVASNLTETTITVEETEGETFKVEPNVGSAIAPATPATSNYENYDIDDVQKGEADVVNETEKFQNAGENSAETTSEEYSEVEATIIVPPTRPTNNEKQQPSETPINGVEKSATNMLPVAETPVEQETIIEEAVTVAPDATFSDDLAALF